MSDTNWANQSADWTTAADWSAGTPSFLLHAHIDFAGAYTVSITSAAQANSLTLDDGSGAILQESAGGSLAVRTGFDVYSGALATPPAATPHHAAPPALREAPLLSGHGGRRR